MNTILPTGSHSQHPSLRSQPTAEPNKARTDAMTAGVALLLLTALATFGALIAVDRTVTTGNAARTAADITQSLTTFRLGIAALLAVAALDIVVAYALQRFLAPVSHGLSTLAAWLRVAYAAVFATAIAHLAGAARLVGDQTTDVGQVLGKVDTYRDTWSAGLVLFGVHLLVVGFLLLRSGFTSKWLGVLVGPPESATSSTASSTSCPTAPGPASRRSPASASSSRGVATRARRPPPRRRTGLSPSA
jgi:Domain of unknown function (DUF4386)